MLNEQGKNLVVSTVEWKVSADGLPVILEVVELFAMYSFIGWKVLVKMGALADEDTGDNTSKTLNFRNGIVTPT